MFGKIDRMLEKPRTVSFALEFLVDYQVFQQHNEAALSSADGEQQIDHSHDRPILPQHKDAPPARLFKNQAQTTKLFFLVRAEVAFLSKQITEHFRQFVEVGFGCRLNHYILFFAHCLLCLFQKSAALAIKLA